MADLFGDVVESSQFGTVPRAPKAQATARSMDAPTSHAAAREQNRSGRTEQHCEIVMRLVLDYPGSTAVELFHAQGGDSALDRVEVGRRLDSLVKAGKVRKGEIRECRVKKVAMLTWWPREVLNDQT